MRHSAPNAKKVEDFYAGLVTCCKSLAEVRRAQARVFQSGHRRNVYLCNLLLQMYLRCGSLPDACALFGGMDNPCPVSWNMMIAAHGHHGELDQAKSAFDGMGEGRSVISWTSLLQAYVSRAHLEEAKRVFSRMPMANVITWTSLVQAHVNAGKLEGAKTIFDEMPFRNIFAWNALVAAYAQEGRLDESRVMIERMPQWDIISWNSAVTAYAHNGQVDDAKEIFADMPERNVVSWNAAMAALGMAFEPVSARAVFDAMPSWDCISWNTLVAAYARAGKLREAWKIFSQMPIRNRMSWMAVMGMFIHHGDLEGAEAVFSIAPEKQTSWSWNAMVAAYAKSGRSSDALRMFRSMHCEGVSADEVSFVTVLGACVHEGLVDECRQEFASMIEDHGLTPLKDHYCCMIDTLGRAGRLDLAQELLERMPIAADAVTWGALLGACSNIHGGDGSAAAISRRAAHQLRRIDPRDVASYLLLTKGIDPIDGGGRLPHPAPATSSGHRRTTWLLS